MNPCRFFTAGLMALSILLSVSSVCSADISGQWNGSWTSTAYTDETGGLNMDITQSGETVTIVVDAYNTDCDDLIGVNAAGTYSGNMLNASGQTTCGTSLAEYRVQNALVTGDRMTGAYTIYVDGEIYDAGTISLTQSDDDPVTDPDPDDSDCRIDINGMTIVGTRETGKPVVFTLSASNTCSDTTYYRFSMHPGYGTSAYDGKQWTQMTQTEYQTSNICTYTFDTAGQYIVVVWVKNDTTDPNNGVKIIGLEVEIREADSDPYFPF